MTNSNQVVVSQVNDVTTVEITTAGAQGIQGIQGEAGASTFTGLTDTPANFVAGKVLKVNGAANAIEYADDINTTNLSYTASTRVLASDTGTNATLPLVDTTNAGLLSASDKTKLDGIEANSKDDQTGAEIKSLYEAESNTNAFSDAEKNKLAAIEASATADQTDAEIRAAVEAATDSNVFTDADHTKLNGIEAGATADQTNAEIKTAYEANSDTNAFTDADHSKLDGIEASADVTDATNVDAAGAVMNSDTTTAGMSFVVDEDNMSSNSATKVPTQQSVKAYVDTEVAGVVDSAPSALNTLNELAAALGDDANFSTTVTNSIGTKLPLAGGTMTGNIVMSGTQTVDGRDISADGTKLDGIETGATADQTATEIKTAYESNSNTNAYTDAEQTKLSGIEASATADQTAAEIRTLVESANDSNVFTDADHTKLNAIEASATADQTGAEIKSLYEAESNTNAFTDADHSKLDGIESGATADQTASDIKTLLNSSGLVNAQIDASAAIDVSKLSGVFPSAGGTLTGNLTISSTLPKIILNDTNNESDFEIKNENGSFRIRDIDNPTDRFRINNSGTIHEFFGTASFSSNIAVGGTVDGVDIATRDTLFGSLTSNSGVLTDGVTATTQSASDNSTKVATTAYVTAAIGNATISGSQISANAIDTTKIANDAVTTDKINLISTSSVPSLEAKGDGSTDGYIQLNCSQNSHGVKLKAPPHSASASYTFTLPNDIQNGKVLSTDASGNTSWVDNYTNTSVDTHLNTGTASNNEVLSWNGSDYTWVAQSVGGGGSMNNLVEDTSPQLGGNLDMQSNNITGTGTITANSVASSANGMRKITASTSTPSGGSDGDIWIKYTA